MAVHVTDHRGGFGPGRTEITRIDDPGGAGIGLASWRMEAGERVAIVADRETALLLLEGAVDVEIGPRRERWARRSVWDEGPSCAHVCAGTELALHARTPVELLRFECASTARWDARTFGPTDVADEHRGRGQVGGACHRIVRTIVDDASADPAAELVLGEVLTPPGRWSSYPPHHHAQPEIYHYRFTHPQGYGHAELGETVLKVRAFDTVTILPPNDHAQAAAPGYGMYYAWVIRHLPGNRYRAPEFTEEHRWVVEPGAAIWSLPESPPGDARTT